MIHSSFDAARAGRAALDRLDLGQQRLLGEGPLVDLADLLVRPDDPVDEDREDEEERREEDDQAAARYGRIGLAVRSCMSRNAQYADASHRMTM